jgi:hypothetical protein
MDSLIKKVKTQTGLIVYHVEDCGIIQEFRTLLEAKEFVKYINNPKAYMINYNNQGV